MVVTKILEGIFKGLLQWVYDLILEIVEYIANNLLDVFSMDLEYFEQAIPVVNDVLAIIIGTGWALLLGNLVFQASKSMISGLGFEGEDPKELFARTFVFAFFLLASRQICNIGLNISNTVITMLQIPDSVSVNIPGESLFSIGAAWLLVIIAGFVLMWQLVKLFFAVGERYFLVGLLTILAPWAFAMGGSRNTMDIFKGWARMFATMCLMMIMNVLFLKMLLSVMGTIPSGPGVVPWIIFAVAITRTAKKIDGVVMRIGMNPAPVGGNGRSLPGMLSFMVMRTVANNVIKSAGGGAAGKSKAPPGGNPKPAGAPSAGTGSAANRSNQNNYSNRSAAQNTATSQSSQNAQNSSQQSQSSTQHSAGNTAAGATSANTSTSTQSSSPGAAGTVPGSASSPVAPIPGTQRSSGANTASSGVNTGAAGRPPIGTPPQTPSASPGAAGNQPSGLGQPSIYAGGGATSQQSSSTGQTNSRRSSVTKSSNARSSVFSRSAAAVSGAVERAGTAAAASASARQETVPMHPPIPRSGNAERSPAAAAAQPAAQGSFNTSNSSRYSSIPQSAQTAYDRSGAPGAAGTYGNSSIQQGGVSINSRNQTNLNADQNESRHESYNISNRENAFQPEQNAQSAARGFTAPYAPGAAGTRMTSVPAEKPRGPAGTITPSTPVTAPSTIGAAGTDARRNPAPPSNTASRPTADTQRSGGNPASVPHGAQASGANAGTARQEYPPRSPGEPVSTRKPSPGAAGRPPYPANTPYPVTKPAMAGTRQASSAAASSARIGKNNMSAKKKNRQSKKFRKGKGK